MSTDCALAAKGLIQCKCQLNTSLNLRAYRWCVRCSFLGRYRPGADDHGADILGAPLATCGRTTLCSTCTDMRTYYADV